MSLPEEIVSLPDQRDRLWSILYSEKVLQFAKTLLGKNWREKYLRTLGYHLARWVTGAASIVWTPADDRDDLAFRLYLSVSAEEQTAKVLLDSIATDLSPTEITSVNTLPADTFPVFKRLSDGTVVRLWPAPGPHLPKKESVTIDLGSYQVLNCVHRIQAKE